MSVLRCGGCLNPIFDDEVEGHAFDEDGKHPYCAPCWDKADMGRCERCREWSVGREVHDCGGETMCASCHEAAFEEAGGTCDCSRLAGYLGREVA